MNGRQDKKAAGTSGSGLRQVSPYLVTSSGRRCGQTSPIGGDNSATGAGNEVPVHHTGPFMLLI
jgi:hypothetical protein